MVQQPKDIDRTLSRPLEALLLLMDASPSERSQVAISKFGDDFRWDNPDEVIQISSFHETAEPDYDNDSARLFSMFPQLNVSEVARSTGINKSLLAKYIYGITKSSRQMEEQISSQPSRAVSDCLRNLKRTDLITGFAPHYLVSTFRSSKIS